MKEYRVRNAWFCPHFVSRICNQDFIKNHVLCNYNKFEHLFTILRENRNEKVIILKMTRNVNFDKYWRFVTDILNK